MANYHEAYLGFLFLANILQNDATLQGLAPGGVWRGLAPPAEATPFVVMSHQAGSDVTTMNGIRVMGSLLYQVKAVGPSSATAAVAQAAARIDRLLGGPPGVPASGLVVVASVTEAQVYACWREQPLLIDEAPVAGEEYVNMGGLYRMQLSQVAT